MKLVCSWILVFALLYGCLAKENTQESSNTEVSLGKQVLEFPEPNSTNRLEYFNEKPRQIYNITVCLWFQASKQSTESSTVFSLATNQSDNAFTVFLDKTNRKIALYLQTGKPVRCWASVDVHLRAHEAHEKEY
ncbi:predicted protein [Nematostella vectensis]|uniref:Pentraxin (PTX) domain-containing protein n=1 Tax=Nematostella vectensis TaxID=45351 RepID=A7RP87_NEMVE|nr:predicted protein [Nematostella vectensis]|eukprot:XP_001638757.1 predicted protein [Nematostella vectensis]